MYLLVLNSNEESQYTCQLSTVGGVCRGNLREMEREVLRGVVRVSFENADTEQVVVSRGIPPGWRPPRSEGARPPSESHNCYTGHQENLRSTIFLAPDSKFSKDFTLAPLWILWYPHTRPSIMFWQKSLQMKQAYYLKLKLNLSKAGDGFFYWMDTRINVPGTERWRI